jgi:acyl-CoA thioesterase
VLRNPQVEWRATALNDNRTRPHKELLTHVSVSSVCRTHSHTHTHTQLTHSLTHSSLTHSLTHLIRVQR